MSKMVTGTMNGTIQQLNVNQTAMWYTFKITSTKMQILCLQSITI